MAGYQLTTFAQLITALSLRLSDPTFVFWNQNELRAYLREALRTWQAYSQFYSTQAQITTTANTFLYNLSSLIPQLVPSLTDRDVMQDIQRYLQEPVNPITWTGTEQFNYAAVVQAIQGRRDRFILEAGLAQQIAEVSFAPPPQSTLEINDTIIDIRRVMWKTVPQGIYSLLWKADQYAFMAGNTQWFIQPGFPTDYSTALDQPLSIQLSPPPAALGAINMLTVNSGPILNPSVSPTILGIPDDFVWVVKFGALADLFSTPGPGADPERAAYCEARWTDGIQLARITNFVKLGQQNGVPAFIDSMEELDAATPSWVSSTPGVPKSMAVSGNIAAVSPIPDAGPYSLLFDITPKMVVPVIDSDFVQIGQEFLDIILDYAQHLASVKVGISEIQASYQLYKNFASAASVENDTLRANAGNFDVMSDRTARGAHETPRRKSDINLQPLEINT